MMCWSEDRDGGAVGMFGGYEGPSRATRVVGWIVRPLSWAIGAISRPLAIWLSRPGRAGQRFGGVVGSLIRHSLRGPTRRSALARIPVRELHDLCRRDEATRALVLGLSTAEFPPAVLIGAATSAALRGPVAEALSSTPHVANMADEVAGAGTRIPVDERIALLATATRIAHLLTDDQARRVLGYSLDAAAADPGPYAIPDNAVAARQAAAALLREHPLLDDVVLGRLGTPRSESDLEIYAASLSRRPRGRAAALAALLQRWTPSATDALAFAARADVERLRVVPAESEPIRHLWQSTLVDVVRLGIRWLSVPVVLAVVGGIAWHRHWSVSPLKAGFGEAVAALAVIAAVHVVSAQLAAGRLDGVIARQSASSQWLIWSYTSALVLAIVTFIPVHGMAADALSWVGLAAAAGFLLSITLSAISLVRQSEPARAAVVFVASRRLIHRWTGWRLSRARRSAVEQRERLASMRAVTLVPDPRFVDRRGPVPAGRRGFHFVRLRRLRRRVRGEPWSRGHLQLQVLARLGTIVDRSDEIGALVPDEGTALESREVRRVARVFHQRSSSSEESAAEAAVVLVRLVSELARRGDSGAAARTSDAFVKLLSNYASAARVRNQDVAGSTMFPVVWPLRAAVEAMASAISTATTHLERESLSTLAERFIRIGSASDATVNLLLTQDSVFGSTLNPIQLAGLARAMARRALELGDAMNLSLVTRFIDRHIMRGGTVDRAMAEAASEFPATAAWMLQPAAMRLWDWFVGFLTQHPTDPDLLVGAIRAGAANLLAGSSSVAVRVVLDMRGVLTWATDAPALREATRSGDQQFTSDFGGGYLGNRPDAAIDEFIDFALSVDANVV